MKKSLMKSIAIATAIGAAASAHAVNIDQDGHGSALLFPAYTVENGNTTYVSVTNTTDQYKAVKVRFVEGMNSKEVLDFNLYLSPKDAWNGMVVPTAGGAKLVSKDTSCISAFRDGFPEDGMVFRNYEFSGVNADAPTKLTGLDRTRVGHLEIIEMGDISPTLVLGKTTAGQAIEHVDGTPGNCGVINDAWNAGGVWKNDNSAGMTVGSGGLYGAAAIVNVDAGWASTYDATALANFVDNDIHTEPGSVFPNLGQAEPESVFKEGTVGTPAVAGALLQGYDAVSAILMKEEIQNDYLVGASLNAQTDMVITFPTKRHYVNQVAAPGYRAPFTTAWNTTDAKACESVEVTYYDTEEGSLVLQDEQISPKPPVGEGLSLCHETNILHIAGSDLLGGGLYEGHNLGLAAGFNHGWINVDFRGTGREIDMGLSANNPKGLPAIGFATIATQNGDVGGLLSNYAQSFAHKATTTIE